MTAFRSLTQRDQSALDGALQGAALFGRDDLVAVVASGKQRARFLHALLTWDVNGMVAPASAEAAFCDAQGRIQALMGLVVEDKRIIMWTERRLASELTEGLLAYRVAERVKLAEEPELGLLELVGPQAQAIAHKVGLSWPEPGEVDMWQRGGSEGLCWSGVTGGTLTAPHGPGVPTLSIQVPDDAIGELAGELVGLGASVGCHTAREVLRIRAGQPRMGLDVADGSLPAELGLGAAVHMGKGCYLGQEAIAMQLYRGRLRRHLCWIEADSEPSPGSGWTLRDAAGRKAGTVCSGYKDLQGRALGLALISRRAWQPGVELTASGPEDASVTVRGLATTIADAFEAKGEA